MLLTSFLKSFVVYLYYLKKVFYTQDSLISKPCELENINFQLINRESDNQLYQNFPLFIARPEYFFQHSVASGDSSSSSTIFWTRVTPRFKVAKSSLIPVYFLLALDECFQNEVLSGVTYTNSLIDFTIKLHIRDLSPNTRYFFKFYDIERGSTSDVGISRTLPRTISPDDFINLDITDSTDYITDATDPSFILQFNGYQNKLFTRLKDYRYRYSKEFKPSNLTTLFGSNPYMYTRDFKPDDHSQALLEWFPIRPPKRYLHGKFFEIGDVLKINILDKTLSSSNNSLTNEFDHELSTKWNLVYSLENPNLLEFQNLVQSNNSIMVNLRDHDGLLSAKISGSGLSIAL